MALASVHSIRLPPARRGLICLPVRCHAAGQREDSPHSSGDPTSRRSIDSQALRGVTLLLAAAVMAQTQPAAAATRSIAWQPRRHYRRLPRLETDIEEVEQTQAAAPAQQVQEEQQTPGSIQEQLTEFQRSVGAGVSSGLHTVQSGVESAGQRIGRVRSGAEHQLSIGSVGVDTRGPAHNVQPLVSRESLGLVASVVGGGALLWLLFSKLLPAIFQPSRRADGGKWVRDRSMGGKEILVPDVPQQVASTAKPASRRQTKLPESPGFVMPESGTRVVAAGGQRRPAAVQQEPEWWSEPRPPMYVHQNQKDEGKRAAKRILRDLEDAKLAGRNYPTSAIVELRETCQAAGISVEASTQSGRDSIFRTAVSMALAAALADNSKLAGVKPQQFVCGVAKDLGIPMQRAVQIVHSEVASRTRTLIINACASRRASNTPEEMNQLLRLAALLSRFPLPRNSAEGEVIASSIAARCWLSERQAAFMTYGAMEPFTAPLMAELLGFDPELVLPQLEEYTRNI